MPRFAALLAASGAFALACSESSGAPEPGAPAGTGGTGGAEDGTWTPGTVFPSGGRPNARGLLDVRGVVHAHSVYSHDACDGAPRDPATGAIDQQCFDDFRRGLCQAKHDFVFLTDHDTSFSETEFPEVLLYRPERGDNRSAWWPTPNGGAFAGLARGDHGWDRLPSQHVSAAVA